MESRPQNQSLLENATFSTSAKDIQKLIDNLKPNVDRSFSFTIAPEACLGEFDEYFKCLICLQMV